jgi:hypothetical protein
VNSATKRRRRARRRSLASGGHEDEPGHERAEEGAIAQRPRSVLEADPRERIGPANPSRGVAAGPCFFGEQVRPESRRPSVLPLCRRDSGLTCFPEESPWMGSPDGYKDAASFVNARSRVPESTGPMLRASRSAGQLSFRLRHLPGDRAGSVFPPAESTTVHSWAPIETSRVDPRGVRGPISTRSRLATPAGFRPRSRNKPGVPAEVAKGAHFRSIRALRSSGCKSLDPV